MSDHLFFLLFLQCRGMFAMIAAVGMSCAGCADHCCDGRIFASAVFAGVFLFLASFVELMLAFVGSVGMTRTKSCCQLLYARIRLSAVFAIKCSSFHIFDCLESLRYDNGLFFFSTDKRPDDFMPVFRNKGCRWVCDRQQFYGMSVGKVVCPCLEAISVRQYQVVKLPSAFGKVIIQSFAPYHHTIGAVYFQDFEESSFGVCKFLLYRFFTRTREWRLHIIIEDDFVPPLFFFGE